jgi:hypothetical protein
MIDVDSIGATRWSAQRAVSEDAPLPAVFDRDAVQRYEFTERARWRITYDAHHGAPESDTVTAIRGVAEWLNRLPDWDLWQLWQQARRKEAARAEGIAPAVG